jgi:hypothetical protein
MPLASSDCRPKDIRILSVIVSELKLCDEQRKIFAAHLVKTAHNAA